MTMAARFLAGIAFGFEINAAPGVYLSIYLSIIEIVLEKAKSYYSFVISNATPISKGSPY